MKKLFSLFTALLFLGTMWGATTYEQLTSIANIDEGAEYVLGIDGTGFHYSGTSSWGLTALPSAQTPIKYTLKKAQDGQSFTAEATISSTKYYLQVPTSNTFSMATSAGTNTDLIIGTTQVSGTNYAVANKTTTARHLRINGTSGLRSYASTTGTMAFFYKVVNSGPSLVSVAVSGTPDTKTYEDGNAFDVTGLTVTGTYSDASSSTIADGITWKARTNAGSDDAVALENYHLTAGQTSLQVQAIVSGISSDWTTINGLTVTEHVVTPGTYKVRLDNVLFGTTVNKNITSAISATINDITIDIPAEGTTKPRTDATYVRFYSGSSITMSVPSGYEITKIEYKHATGNADEQGHPSATEGTIDTENKRWTGNENEVTLSFSSKSFIDSLYITYAVPTPRVALVPNELAWANQKQHFAPAAKTFKLKGANLTSGLSLAASTGFTVSPTSLTAEQAMHADSAIVTVKPNTPTGTTTVNGTITISGGGLTPDSVLELSMTITPTYEITLDVENGTLGWNPSFPTYAAENETFTLTATPNSGYEGGEITILDGEDNDITGSVLSGSTLTMPAYEITVKVRFSKLPCTPLATPTNVIDVVDITSAMLGWDDVENADKYTVYIYTNSDVEVEHGDVTINEYTVKATLTANTTYKYTIQAKSDTPETYCESNLKNGTFKTDNYPDATLRLSENRVIHDFDDGAEHVVTDKITLPSTVSRGVDGKVFVGWSADSVRTTAPEYAKGAEYTLSAEIDTLYAVYATKTGEDALYEHTYDLTTADDDWIGDGTEIYFTQPYGFKNASAKMANKSIADFENHANEASSITINVKCLQNGSVAGRLTVYLVDKDGNNISNTGKEITPVNDNAASRTTNQEVSYAANEVKDKDATGYRIACTTFDKNMLVNGTSYSIVTTASYSAYVTKGTYTPTSFEDVETSVKAVKVLRDGQIFILRGDKTFNAQGQLVK